MNIGTDKNGKEIKIGDVLLYRELVGTEVEDEGDEVEYEEFDHYIQVLEKDNDVIVCDLDGDEWWFLHQFSFSDYKIVSDY